MKVIGDFGFAWCSDGEVSCYGNRFVLAQVQKSRFELVTLLDGIGHISGMGLAL